MNDLPHNTCMCTYHANFIEAVSALHKLIPNVPSYNDGFVRQFLCENSKMDCWFSECNECLGISAESLKDAIGNTSLSSPVSWMVWKQNAHTKRIEKQKESKTLTDLIAHIAALSSQFLKHCFIKREQANTFNNYD